MSESNRGRSYVMTIIDDPYDASGDEIAGDFQPKRGRSYDMTIIDDPIIPVRNSYTLSPGWFPSFRRMFRRIASFFRLSPAQ